MKTTIALLPPLGLLMAWAAPWACQTYTLPDGGTTTTNPNVDGGGAGGTHTIDGGQAVIPPLADAGLTGITAADGGGVTVGPAALFTSDFVYASNYQDGTVSRVAIPGDAGTVPYEQGRYVAIIPENNHGNNVSYPWTESGCNDQLAMHSGGIQGVPDDSTNANTPSRTVVDRKGNVVVALRAPGCQAGATRIINVGDNLSSCHVRCPNRNGLALVNGQPQHFTEGIPLVTTNGSIVTLLPSTPPAADHIQNPVVLSDHVIAPGTTAATTYSCPGHSPDDETDPVNYDDCLDFSVALGSPNPDPDADPHGLTRNASFGRAAAISPNCDPNTNNCDTWIGLYNGASWVHLANGANPPLQFFDVQSVDYTGVPMYGGTVDCAGVLWGTYGTCSTSVLSAVTTVPLNDPNHGLLVPEDTVITTYYDPVNGQVLQGIPNNSACGGYGISSDTSDRIWVAGCPNSYTCSFNASLYLADYAFVVDAGAALAALAADAGTNYVLDAGLAKLENQAYTNLTQAWQSYNWNAVGMGGRGRGIAVDKNNNVYQGFDEQNPAAASLNPDPPTGAYTGIPCSRSGGASTCVDRNGNPTPNGGQLKWTSVLPTGSNGTWTVGVDLDAENNLWTGQFYNAPGSTSTAIRLNGATGALMTAVPVGSGLYSYSDFTGYALREITLSTATYEQSIVGCPGGESVSPEYTEWLAMNFQANLPPGTDLRFAVSVTQSNDPAVVAAATTYQICTSVASGSCGAVDANGNGAISLKPYNLPAGSYLNIFATLVPRICSAGGGSTATAKPVLYQLGAVQKCVGD